MAVLLLQFLAGEFIILHSMAKEINDMLKLINSLTLAVSLAVIGTAIILRIKNRHSTEEAFNSNSRSDRMVFMLIITAALLLRAWKFGVIPGGINQDGAMAAVDANALAHHGTDRYGMFMPVHFTAWGYGQMSTLLSYCMIPFIKLFGLSALSARLPILIVSMAGMAAVYFIVRRLIGVRAGQIILLLTAFNPWHFMQSRWALDCNMLPHMFVIALALLLKGMEGKRAWAYLSMVFFALCMYSYGVAFYTVTVFLAVTAFLILIKKVMNLKEILFCLAVYLGISWPIFMTMAVNTFKLKTITTPFFTIPYFPYSVRSGDILFFSDNKLIQLKSNIRSLVGIILRGDNLLWNTIEGYGVINICLVPFAITGLCYVIYRIYAEKEPICQIKWLSVLGFFGIGILDGLITSNVNVNRVNIICYALIILAGIGVWFAVCNFRKSAVILAPVFVLISALYVGTYFTKYEKQIAPVFFSDYLEAVQYVGENEYCRRYVLTPDTQYKGAMNVSEILTLFIHDIDSEYYQNLYPDENGLLYREKYTFANASDTGISEENDVGYVIWRDEKSLFESENFEITDIGRYCAVVPKA